MHRKSGDSATRLGERYWESEWLYTGGRETTKLSCRETTLNCNVPIQKRALSVLASQERNPPTQIRGQEFQL